MCPKLHSLKFDMPHDYFHKKKFLSLNPSQGAEGVCKNRICDCMVTRGDLRLQDNAPAYTSQVAITAATESGFEILLNPPYSPNIAPFEIYLFPKLKSHLRGTQYGSNEGVIEEVNEYLGDCG